MLREGTDEGRHLIGRDFDIRAHDGAARILLSDDGSSAPVIVEDTRWLLSAHFQKHGTDLVLTGDGKSLVLVNYFGRAHKPDLMSGGGALLTANLVERLSAS